MGHGKGNVEPAGLAPRSRVRTTGPLFGPSTLSVCRNTNSSISSFFTRDSSCLRGVGSKQANRMPNGCDGENDRHPPGGPAKTPSPNDRARARSPFCTTGILPVPHPPVPTPLRPRLGWKPIVHPARAPRLNTRRPRFPVPRELLPRRFRDRQAWVRAIPTGGNARAIGRATAPDRFPRRP